MIEQSRTPAPVVPSTVLCFTLTSAPVERRRDMLDAYPVRVAVSQESHGYSAQPVLGPF